MKKLLARAAIGGYVLSHDVSEREFQLERGGQWVKGKSAATFNPCGPYLVTPENIEQAVGFLRGDRQRLFARQPQSMVAWKFALGHAFVDVGG